MLDLRRWSVLSLAPLLLGPALAHPVQQPLVATTQNPGLPANYTSFELRRYGVSGHEDLTHMIGLANQANIDIWHLTPSHVDVHMDTTSDLPDSLASRRYTTLPHSFPYNYNYNYNPTTPSSSKRPKIDLSSLEDNEFHRAYHTYEEIDQFVVALASQYPKLVEVVWLGASSEQRDVFAIRIGSRSRGGNKKQKKHKKEHTAWTAYPLFEVGYDYASNLISRLAELGGLISRGHATTMRDLYSNPKFDAITKSRPIKNRVVIQGAQHAREWIASATALYVAHALVAPEDEAGSLRHLLDDFDFTIIPVPNPDGYAYTWTTDRLWYKNRMQLRTGASTSDECQGIDMNRNWGYQWNISDGFSGVPQDPCSHWYPGAYPFQAPEVTAIANYIRRTPKIRAFLDLRSYGQQLMYPYSYSCEHVAPHAEDLIEAALGATKALRETHGVPYTSGASCELLYPAPGNIIDWMYGDANVKYSYSLMLRDTGTYGFLLPPRQIQPVGEETAASVKSLVKFIENVGM